MTKKQTNKQTKNKLNMGLFKKYVIRIISFFIPFNYLSHFIDFTLTLPMCYLLNFTKKLQNERKFGFVFGCFSLSYYIKGGKKSQLETQLNFWTNMLYKQPTLTKWCNYNIFVQILYSYFRCTGRFFLGCSLFVARCNIIRVS